jgi:predicted alpha-1,2-mannosidase
VLAAPAEGAADPAALVDPLIGTGGVRAGATFPGAVVPFGMVQFSPVSAAAPGYAGYRYADRTIRGFALTRLSGAGCVNYGDFPLMPLRGPFAKFDPATVATTFSHRNEHATAGEYRVRLDSQIDADLTATTRTGFATFRFPTRQAWLAIDAAGERESRSSASFAVTDARTVELTATTYRFCGGPTRVTVHGVAQFDRPIAATGTWGQDDVVHDGATRQEGENQAGALLRFDLPPDRTLRVRIGLSFVSLANAALNLGESRGRDRAAIAARARTAWNQRLGRIRVEGGTLAQRRTFTSALYHSLIHPTIVSDRNGQYIGRDGRVRTALGYVRYSNISGWDVYRTQIPLLAWLAPRVASDVVRSLVAGAQEGGRLGKWELGGSETGVMVGDPALPIIAGAYAFGARAFDSRAALDVMIRGATAAQPGPYFSPSRNLPAPAPPAPDAGDAYVERPGLADYLRLGYIPLDQHEGFIWGPAATTLEYAVADFALSRFALATGDRRAARPFAARAGNWRRLVNPGARFIDPRLANGSFPTNLKHTVETGFVEGNATQYTWFVPHDVAGLVGALGGPVATRMRLDAFFSSLGTTMFSPHAWMGNEPSFGTPWLYLWLGEPWRTQRLVRRLVDTLFGAEPAGLPGDDDLGALSSWYVWSALGLYPAIPGVGGLAVGSPLFPRVTVKAGGGTLTIASEGRGPYVRGLTLDGRAYGRTWIDAARLRGPHTLRFELGFVPQRAWGSTPAARPPSFSG